MIPSFFSFTEFPIYGTIFRVFGGNLFYHIYAIKETSLHYMYFILFNYILLPVE